MADLLLWQWAVLAVAAVAVGFAKTAINGAGALAVVLYAWVLPARESTGLLLPVLLAADLVAVAVYRAHADWRVLARMFPWVAVGVVLGAVFVSRADDRTMQITIGITLLVLTAVETVRTARERRSGVAATVPEAQRAKHGLAAGAGVLAGLTTMVANAASAVTSLYFLLSGLSMLRFLGTAAWFFLVVNLFKVPFSVGLGLLTWHDLLLDLLLVPAVVAGAWFGVLTIKRINQQQFENATLAVVAVAAVLLLLV